MGRIRLLERPGLLAYCRANTLIFKLIITNLATRAGVEKRQLPVLAFSPQSFSTMFYHDKRTQYKVRVDKPNPAMAKMLQQALGGIDGEIRVCLHYLFQAWNSRGPATASRCPGLPLAGCGARAGLAAGATLCRAAGQPARGGGGGFVGRVAARLALAASRHPGAPLRRTPEK